MLLRMIGICQVTFRAFHHMPTAAAGNKGCIPSAVQKEHGLLALLQIPADFRLQCSAERRTVALCHKHPRQNAAARPLL